MTHPFTSTLARDLQDFLAFKQALGHPYRRAVFTLRSFDRYVYAQVSRTRRLPFERLLLDWLAQRPGRKPVSVTNELGVIRQFCRFRRRRDPDAFVPGRAWAPQSTESTFVPHVFSPEEVRALLQQVWTLRGPAFRALTIRTLLLVLYCTGLRFGEALRLRVADVDLAQRRFVVRESKGKTRLVPFRTDLAHVLRRYLVTRRPIAGITAEERLLLQPSGRPYRTGAASDLVRRLLRRAGLKPPTGRAGPRPYDMRHTFAVHRLTRWYRAGVDLHARLPLLAVYLGHESLLGTEVYLTATPELLALAGQRFAARVFDRRRSR